MGRVAMHIKRDVAMGTRRGPAHPRRLWIFLALGVITTIVGLVIVILHLNIQTVTSSTQLSQILPYYIAGIAVSISGLNTVILYWRRPLPLVFVTVIISVAVGSLCAAAGALTGTHILRPIISLKDCSYDNANEECVCSSIYRRDILILEVSDTESTLYTFKDTSGCGAIRNLLPVLLYSQIALYTAVFCLQTLTTIIAFLVLRWEKTSAHFGEETYEEIFTVSGTSSENDSVHDNGSSERQNPDNTSPKDEDYSVALDTKTSWQSGKIAGILKRSDTVVNGDSETTPREGQKLARARSCDSIDEIYAQSSKRQTTPGSFPVSADTVRGKGKLKEHRRRERRAVTLHNLDTKQLMSVLSLHLRYMEETRTIHAQEKLELATSLPHPEIQRRAVTPQPYHWRPKTSSLPRSHTPQPQHKMADYFLPLTKQSDTRQETPRENTAGDTGSSKVKVSPKQPMMGIALSKSLPGHRRKQCLATEATPSAAVSSIYDITNDLHVSRRPKSRPSVRDHFLPPEPMHRSKSAVPPSSLAPHGPLHRASADTNLLPSQPLSRRHLAVHDVKDMPPSHVTRNGSAFQVVNSNERVPCSPYSVLCDQAFRASPHHYMDPRDVDPSPNIEKAVRANFSLCDRPFMTQDVSSALTDPGHDRAHYASLTASDLKTRSLPPPPYAPPPSYQRSMSISHEGSSSDCVDDDGMWDAALIPNRRQPPTGASRDRASKSTCASIEGTTSSDEEVFLHDNHHVANLRDNHPGNNLYDNQFGTKPILTKPMPTVAHDNRVLQAHEHKNISCHGANSQLDGGSPYCPSSWSTKTRPPAQMFNAHWMNYSPDHACSANVYGRSDQTYAFNNNTYGRPGEFSLAHHGHVCGVGNVSASFPPSSVSSDLTKKTSAIKIYDEINELQVAMDTGCSDSSLDGPSSQHSLIGHEQSCDMQVRPHLTVQDTLNELTAGEDTSSVLETMI